MVNYRFEVTKKLRTGPLTKLLSLAERRFKVTNHKSLEAFVFEGGIRIDPHENSHSTPNEITFLSNGHPRSDLIIYQSKGTGITDHYVLARAMIIDEGDVSPGQMQINRVDFYPERYGQRTYTD